MSHILDALQKSQDEKRTTQKAVGSADSVLVTPRPLRKKFISIQRPVLLTAVAVVVMLASVAIYRYLKTSDIPPASSAGIQPGMTGTTTHLPPAPALTPPPAVMPPPPAVMPPPPAPPAPPPLAVQETIAPEPAMVKNISGDKPDKAAKTGSRKEIKAELPMIDAPAGIRVDGVAWQDERKARRAVVNGVLLAEGNLVNGATIMEILKNKVLFTQNGSVFEIAVPH